MSNTKKDAVAKRSHSGNRKYTSGAVRSDVRGKSAKAEIEEAAGSAAETSKFNHSHKTTAPVERYKILRDGETIDHMNSVETLVQRRIRRDAKRKPGQYAYCLVKNPSVIFEFKDGQFSLRA